MKIYFLQKIKFYLIYKIKLFMKIENLKGNIPDAIYRQLTVVMIKFEINTIERLSHFLGQAKHESGNFTALNENLDYSSERLLLIFPKYFKGKDVSEYNKNPEKIGNLVYANRMGNSDVNSGDGYKFRGRGAFQLTGKANYEALGKALNENLIANPDLVSTKYSLISAAWFFQSHKLNSISDKGMGVDVITQISKVINGGTIGLDKRILLTNDVYKLLQ
jgi:putative chitinase